MTLNARCIEEDGSFSNDVRFERLYDRHHAHVTAYCRRRVSADRVEDLVAETFLVAWRRIDDVPDGEAGLPWLYPRGIPLRWAPLAQHLSSTPPRQQARRPPRSADADT